MSDECATCGMGEPGTSARRPSDPAESEALEDAEELAADLIDWEREDVEIDGIQAVPGLPARDVAWSGGPDGEDVKAS